MNSNMCKCGKCNKWVHIDKAQQYKVLLPEDEFPAYTRMRLCKDCHQGEELNFSFKQHKQKVKV